MKKGVVFAVKLIAILSLGFMVIGCASTVKLSPELTKNNAALINLISEFKDGDSSTTAGIFEIDGERIDSKNKKALVPEGEHEIKFSMVYGERDGYSFRFWGDRGTTTITVQAGKKYTIGCLPVSPRGTVNALFLDTTTHKTIFDQKFTLLRLR